MPTTNADTGAGISDYFALLSRIKTKFFAEITDLEIKEFTEETAELTKLEMTLTRNFIKSVDWGESNFAVVDLNEKDGLTFWGMDKREDAIYHSHLRQLEYYRSNINPYYAGHVFVRGDKVADI